MILMGRKKYFDKIVNCSICGKEYTEILCEDDLPDIVAFHCEECSKNFIEILEKCGIDGKPSRKQEAQCIKYDRID